MKFLSAIVVALVGRAACSETSGKIQSSLDSTSICYRQWSVESPRAAVYIQHGMAEHAGRYADFGSRLAQRLNVTVVVHNHRGHGDCDSSMDILEPVTPTIEVLAQDAWEVVAATSDVKRIPIVFFGHSMGSVVARAMLKDVDALNRVDLRGVILSGVPTAPTMLEAIAFPWIGAGVKVSGWGHRLVQDVLISGKFDNAVTAHEKSSMLRNYSPSPLIRNRFISSDTDQIEAYNGDSLCGGLVSVDLLLSVASSLTAMQNPQKFFPAEALMAPIFFIAGRSDPVCNFGMTAASDAAKMRQAGFQVSELYLGNCRHEFLHESAPIQQEGVEALVSWIDVKIL